MACPRGDGCAPKKSLCQAHVRGDNSCKVAAGTGGLERQAGKRDVAAMTVGSLTCTGSHLAAAPPSPPSAGTGRWTTTQVGLGWVVSRVGLPLLASDP